MRMKKTLLLALAAVILALLAAFALSKTGSSDPAENSAPVIVPDTTAEEAAVVLYENAGLSLPVPSEYEELLQIELPDTKEDGMFFDVSEKASIEAASLQNSESYGAGWLFSIGRVNTSKMTEMLQYDMSYAEVFARDSDDNYYLFYHPTDVRFVRENNEAMQRDQAQWTALNKWAWGSVRTDILSENDHLIPCDTEQVQASIGLPDEQEADELMSELGYTPDDMLGIWSEKIAGRGNIDIRKSTEDGKYVIQINWGSSAFETYVWTMTAEASGSNVLKYNDGKLVILQFGNDGIETEELQYENGTGEFELLSTNELIWQDDIGHAGDDCVFISAG